MYMNNLNVTLHVVTAYMVPTTLYRRYIWTVCRPVRFQHTIS